MHHGKLQTKWTIRVWAKNKEEIAPCSDVLFDLI